MRTIEKTIYKFDELPSERAKDTAREWFRQGMESDWSEFICEDADIIGKMLGIEIDRKAVQLMGGGTRYDPTIWFSGFSSQGDGACFEGRYSYAKKAPQTVRAHAPQDTELHRIASELQALQRKHFFRLEARVKHSGHYYHKYCTAIDVTDSRTGNDTDVETAKELSELLRDFMEWIYRSLEREYEYRTSNEAVDADIEANEYEFNEDGTRCR